MRLPRATRYDDILAGLMELLAHVLQEAPTDEARHVPFLEMGANSLTMMELVRAVEHRFGLKLSIRQLFTELTTAEALAAYLDQHLPPDTSAARVPSAPEATPIAAGDPAVSSPRMPPTPAMEPSSLPADTPPDLARLFAHQLHTTSQALTHIVTQQLAFLRERGISVDAASLTPAPSPASISPDGTAPLVRPDATPVSGAAAASALPFHAPRADEMRARGLTAQQQQHLEGLIARITRKTAESKRRTQHSRRVLADNRTSAGFRFTTKEMLYPIIGVSGRGAHVRDVDGNEYVDLAMGFGVNLFGHNPDFVIAALQEQMSKGIQVGPQSELAGEVAELFTDVTGMERAAFCNSGTEAVMTAMRLARTATGRHKIVTFEGSYHGHFDGTLGAAGGGPAEPHGVPMVSGVTPNLVADLVVLPYGEPASLEVIRARAPELAAVLVEPVQSRRPDFRPTEFLRELRQLTSELGIVLVFDEMITGFRIHQGGAQAWYGIRADLATYGKVVGGGMPIGVVAGSARVMDGIDGGYWEYGDASYPKAETTFFAGTFCKHPLAMAAARAVLTHLRTHGPDLQSRLNRRTDEFAATLNAFFADEALPIRIRHCGSMFRLVFQGNLDLLFYHLLDKGVYTWEGPTCFLSTAHTDDDLARVARAIEESVADLRQGGFLACKPAPQPQSFPLTDAQKQLWVLAQVSPAGSLAYNVYSGVHLTGPLLLPALRQAIQSVVDRHDALRATIDSQGDTQHIAPALPLNVLLIDCTAPTAPEQEARLREWLRTETATPFDLANGPLCRARIAQLATDRHVLVVAAHHLIVDGQSMNVLLRDVAAQYSATVQGQMSAQTPPMQLGTYVSELERLRETNAMDADAAFWQQEYADLIPVLDLPPDHPRPSVQRYQGQRHTLHIETELAEQVRTFSRQQGCTLFMTLFSAYTLLLHRLTGQDDLVVGVPVAGRATEESAGLVAYCTHLLPVRNRLTGSPSVLEYLAAVRDRLLAAYEHEGYPYAALLDALHPPRDDSRSPLVTVTFNLDRPAATPQLSGLATEWQALPIAFAPFEVSLNVTDTGSALVLECDYQTDLFDDTTILRWLDAYRLLLTHLVTAPREQVHRLPIMTDAERQRIVVDWNRTHADYPRQSIAGVFEDQVAAAPAAPAVIFETRRWTYGELNARANQFAHYLRERGVGEETLVGICVDRSVDLVVGLLGILKAGGAYVPLDPTYPVERLRGMIADTGLRVVLTQQSLRHALPLESGEVICVDADWPHIAASSAENAQSAAGPEHLAYVMFTSGSTGRPKGVEIRQKSVVRLVRNTNYASFDATDVILQFAPVSFDASTLEIWGALLNGGCVALMPPGLASLAEFETYLTRYGVTTLWLTAGLFHQIVDEQPTALSSLRQLLAGGDVLSVPHVLRCLGQERRGAVINGYGPTENTTFTCCWPMTAARDVGSTVPIGRPIANTQVYILDRRLQPVPAGVRGELYAGGDGLARGYTNRPELTAEVFLPNPFSDVPGARMYRTGDLARYLSDGRMEFLGRLDQQVKIRGFRVELEEIESTLREYPGVQTCVVVTHSAPTTDATLDAYLVPAQERTLDLQDLRAFLARALPDYMLPSTFTLLEALPLTANGKVDRRALPPPEQAVSGTPYQAPRTPVEAVLVDIWREVLGAEQVGVHDDFFEAGGHSLSATKVAARVRTIFRMELPLQQFFGTRTVAGLVEALIQAEPTPGHVERVARLHQQLAQMSPEELQSLLRQTKESPNE
ncbi:MAG: amino acid adenylation domain-containing protein [Acidobacteriota bacterium]